MEVGPDHALHHGRRPRRRRHADVDACPGCSPPASARRAARRQPPRRQLALRPARVRQARRRVRGAVREGATRPAAVDDAQVEAAARAALAPFERGATRREPVPGPARPAGHDAGPRRHRAHARTRCSRRSTELDELQRARRAASASPGNREYNPGWHTALDLQQPADVSEAITRVGARAQGEPRRPLPRRLPGQGRRVRGKVNIVVRAGAATARCSCEREPIAADAATN